MKKLICTIIPIVFSLALLAGNISQQQAKKVALNFYFEKYNQFEGQIAFKQLTIQLIYKSSDGHQDFYYVFQVNGKGFVIIPADHRLNPVLAYSFKNEFCFENQPSNLKWWLQQIEDQIKFAQEKQLTPDENISEDWAYYLGDEVISSKPFYAGKQVEPLITSLWDQGFPYNLMCPVASGGPGGHVLSGCVATAYAQLLYYWRFPLHGSGYYCYTHPSYGELCADFENTWYGWDEMCDQPQTSNLAIAELMYQLGVAVDMNYGPGSSGARGYPEQIEPWFKISTDYDSLRHAYYTNEEWTNIIIDQLNQGFPVGYNGFTPTLTSGHMWVCDGYQDSNYFHMNWGWGGSSNGYYSLDNLQGFNTYQYIGINFYPDTLNYTYPNYASGPDTLVGLEGSIEDGSGPVHSYMNNTGASWLINPQTEYDSVTNIIIMVKKLDIYNDADRLYIYDGEDNSAPLLAELSGNTLPGNIESAGNKVFIEFITDGSNTAPGFYLNYKTNRPVWCNGSTQMTAPTAAFNDGSGNFYYSNSANCTWIIDPGIAEPITLNFNYFSTEAGFDKLKVYDGVSQELLASLSGYYEVPPEPLVSSSGKILLAFQANSIVQEQGWEVWYDINTNILEDMQAFEVSILPNPFTSDLKINFSLPSDQPVSIRVFDLLGNKSISILEDHLQKGRQSLTGNLEGFLPGIYFCRIQVGNEIVIKKIIKL